MEVVMRLAVLALAVSVLGIGVAGVHAQQQVTLLATILDPSSSAPAETVEPSDLSIAEDGAAARVVKVEAMTRAVKVQVLLDNGIGIGPQNFGDLKKGVRGLLEALPAGVDTTVVTTAPQPRFLVRATKNREELLRGADRLAPDSGAGRFVESITEAAERARKDKDTFTVILAAGTTSGDAHITSVEMQRLFEQLRGLPVTVHVLIFSGSAARSATTGDVQIEAGLAVTKMTGGRYEFINAMSRYVTLLPELGAEVAKQAAGGTKQFRITVQRPDGKSGKLGKVTIGAGAKTVTSVRVE
jgi:hypothetical protein